MARLAVLASGKGSNFQALVEALHASPESSRHDCVLLVHDRKAAFAATRARNLGVPSLHVTYAGRSREVAETEILDALAAVRADIVALAGFMRILSPAFVSALSGRIVNIHPSILPSWPGAHAIQRSFQAGDRVFGVTVHLVDEGMDTGSILAAASFEASPGATLDVIEGMIHEIEHRLYPRVVIDLLDCAHRGGES